MDIDPDDRHPRTIEDKYQRLRVLASALGLLLLGVILLIISWLHSPSTTYRLPRNGDVTVAQHSNDGYQLARDFGLSLAAIGGVGVVYELINRSAIDASHQRFWRDSSSSLGRRVSEDTTLLIAGNDDFINRVLDDERRRTLLRAMILAHLDRSARDLADMTSTQLSGSARLEDYKATYYARDQDQEPHAILQQALITTRQPAPIFTFRFYVLRHEDTEKAQASPDVFVWRYWLAPHEKDVGAILQSFEVIDVRVNGVTLTNVRRGIQTDDSVEFQADYLPIEANQYVIETRLRLPKPNEASYVHLEPGALCKGVTMSCDVTSSKFQCVAVETLRARGTSITTTPEKASQGRIVQTQVHTGAWVLPSASVAFVFYNASEDYNNLHLHPELARLDHELREESDITEASPPRESGEHWDDA